MFLNWMLVIDCFVLMTDLALTASFVSLLKQILSRNGSDGVSLMSVVATVIGRGLHALAGGVFEVHYITEIIPYRLFIFLDCVNGALGLWILICIIRGRRKYDFAEDSYGSPLLSLCGVDTVPARWLFFCSNVIIYGFALTWIKMTPLSIVNVYATSCDAFSYTALLPQLWMFHKEKSINFQLGNFVFYIIVHRVGAMAFYISYAYVKMFSFSSVMRSVGCEIFNILIAADFLYFYCRAKYRGEGKINISVSEFDHYVEDMLK